MAVILSRFAIGVAFLTVRTSRMSSGGDESQRGTTKAFVFQKDLNELLRHFGNALCEPLMAAGLNIFEHNVLICSHGLTHGLPFSSLNLGSGSFESTVFIHYPGLPFAIAAAARQENLGGNTPVTNWLLIKDDGSDSDEPIPAVLLENQLNKNILMQMNSSSVEESASFDSLANVVRTYQRFGLVAMCHGRQTSAYDAEIRIGGENITANDIFGWGNTPSIAILQSCYLGRPRDDHRGNSLGMVSAFMILGSRAVLAFSKPLVDGIAPWISSLVLWHMLQLKGVKEAVELARMQIAQQAWPSDFQREMRKILAEELTALVMNPLNWPLGNRNHIPFEKSQPIIDWRKMAVDWPWEEFESLDRLGICPVEESEALIERVAGGLFFLRTDCSQEFERLMFEQVTFMHVFGH